MISIKTLIFIFYPFIFNFTFRRIFCTFTFWNLFIILPKTYISTSIFILLYLNILISYWKIYFNIFIINFKYLFRWWWWCIKYIWNFWILFFGFAIYNIWKNVLSIFINWKISTMRITWIILIICFNAFPIFIFFFSCPNTWAFCGIRFINAVSCFSSSLL